MSLIESLNRQIYNTVRWIKEVVDCLEIASEAALNSNFDEASMIVAGLEEIVDIYDNIPDDELNQKNAFSLVLKYSILPTKNSIFEVCSEIIDNFQGEKELAIALVKLLAVLAMPQPIILGPIDGNMRRLFAEPGRRYMEEFMDYYYVQDVQDEQDTHNEEEVTVEQLNENYQNLAPSTESQLNRLKNELAITLCEECLTPTRNQECDCWILQIEEY
ncbi:hypothetical protein RhiirA4_483963 [Rhizophagus irregularis]|uniref:Uncharacterized protein n=1 Tax=Rhizophagus irregularis TaxID=588596 RepID=A0A2I1HNA7_9GLOM|nr:hypothetical protein RhiirA4_483963 [Rhizophagus irregularis]